MRSRPHNQLETSREDLQPRRVHTITDRLSIANTYLVDEECLFVIDPGSEKNVPILLKYVQHVLHRSIHDIDLIVLTHLYPNHTAGAEALQKFCHAPIAASACIQQFLAKQRERKSRSAYSPITAKRPTAVSKHDLLQLDYEHQTRPITLWLHHAEDLPNHPDWRTIACPGQTPASLCLYNPFTGELLTGDTINTMRGSGLVRASTNPAQLEETIHTLRRLPVSYLYPRRGRAILSHRPLSNVDIYY